MSGPTTAIFTTEPITALLSAAAIRAAQAIYEGYAEASDLKEDQTAQRKATQASLKIATATGHAALQQAAEIANAEFEKIAGLVSRYVTDDKVSTTRPQLPKDHNELQLAAYVRGMQVLIGELRSILLSESALRMDNLDPETVLHPDIPHTVIAVEESAVQRLLARIAHLGEPPQDIFDLAKTISDTPYPDSERALLLTTELRIRIQQFVEAKHKQSVQDATACILQQSLLDLGYQVEDISSTLFVEGGVVHFRRQGWDNYMVRMRVDPKAGTTNFNVIRSVETHANETSVLDHLAEDRWCAEFPALLKALDIRGVHLNVTRRLEAGELPVQLVQKNKLPEFSDADTTNHNKILKSREIK